MSVLSSKHAFFGAIRLWRGAGRRPIAAAGRRRARRRGRLILHPFLVLSLSRARALS